MNEQLVIINKVTLEGKVIAFESPVSCSRFSPLAEALADVSDELRDDSRSITELLCTGERGTDFKT